MQTSQPKVTVAIVAHKSGEIIEKCIRSITTQDYPTDKYDVLVVDDSNDEATISICKNYNVKYVYAPETNSPGKARNVALEKTDSDIIAFIDTDCVAPPNWISQIVRDFNLNQDVVGVVGCYEGGKNWLQRLVNKEHVRNLKVKEVPTGILEGNCAFKRAALNRKRFGVHKYAEGIVLANQLSKGGLKTLTDYDLRVTHSGFTHTLRKFFKMGRSHYYNTKSYFGDPLKSNIFSAAVMLSLVLLLTAPFISPFLFAPAAAISFTFVFYAHRWHKPIPIAKLLPSYIYFIAARWLFWIGYFVELVNPSHD